MNFDVFRQKFIFLFVSLNIDTNSNSQSFFLYDFMNILQDLHNLRHNNYFFDDLFQDEWYFYKFFFVSNDLNRYIYYPINDL